jgi:DNA polymerase III subunit gamma/tau
MATRSLSYNAALQDLGTLLHRIALAQTVPAALPEDLPEREDIIRLAAAFDAEEVQLFYQIAVHGRNELSLAPDEYAGFSMTLLRMLAFRPGVGAAEAKPRSQMPAATAPVATPPAARLSAAPQAVTSAPVARPANTMSPARAALEAARNGGKLQPVAPAPARTISKAPPPWEEELQTMATQSVAVAEAQKKTEQPLMSAAAEAAPREPQAQPLPVAPATRTRPLDPTPVPSLNWNGDWPSLAASLPLRGVVHQLAQQSELLQCELLGDGAQFHLRIPVDTLRSAGAVDKLANALSEHFGKTIRVQTEIGAVEQTANAAAVAEREARQRQAEQNLHSDPFVQTLMREFGATIVPGSIKPV